MPTMFRDIVRSLLALAALTIICGVAYPLVVWAIGQVAFSDQADGSLVHAGGRVVGSSLLGQDWKGAQWFHGRGRRPSATTPTAPAARTSARTAPTSRPP